VGVRLTTTPRKKILLRNLKRRPRPTQGCRADDDDDDDNVFQNSITSISVVCNPVVSYKDADVYNQT
jgi:hypothetical protein